MRLPDPQRSRVVLIGTSKYEDEKLLDLPAVGRSIDDLAAALKDPAHGLVPEDHCTVLADEGDIRLIGRRLRLAARQAEDLLLVYYAGHGLVGGRRHDLYLALPDSEWVEPEFNSLEYEKLRSAVLDSPATTKVIVLDCCFSGRVVTDTMAGPVSELIGQVGVDGTYVLTSAHRDKVALVIPGEDYTAFTGRLLRLLHDGVPGGPEFLTIDDLYRQLLARMQAEGLPQPQKRGTDSADLLALARNRAYAAPQPLDITVDNAVLQRLSGGPSGEPRLLVVEDQIMTELVGLLDDEFDLLCVSSYKEWRRVCEDGRLSDVRGALIDRHLDVSEPGDSMGTTKVAEYLRQHTRIPAVLMSVDVGYSTIKGLDLCLKYRLLDVIRKHENGTLNTKVIIEAARSLVDSSPRGRGRRMKRAVASVAYHVEDQSAYSRRPGSDTVLRCQEQRDNILRLLDQGDLKAAEPAILSFMTRWAPRGGGATF